MNKYRRNRSEILAGAPPLENWPTVMKSQIGEDYREQFEKRCNAVRMYVEGDPVSQIQEVTGIQRNSISPLMSRCLESATDGQIMGYRALLPYAHLKGYCRSAEVKCKFPEAQGGMSGVFRQTLRKYPALEEKLIQYIKKENSPELNVHEKKIRAKDLHSVFIKFLQKAGVKKDQWPFNTKHQGSKTIQQYLNQVLDESFNRTITTREEQAAIAHLAVGTGHDPFLRFEEPYEAVELDGYSINAFFTAVFETPEGTTTDVQLERIWLLALIETVSRAVLSYSIVYRSEVGADDVVTLLRKAVNPPTKVELTIPGLAYPEKGGLPSEVFPECQGAIWGLLLLDGALANLANSVHVQARKALGFSINWGPVGHFERRPDVERYFSYISHELFMRLNSTTGSNPKKGRAKNAEANAVIYKIRAEEIEQLVAVFTAQHNATPNEGISYNSPLEVMQYFVEKLADHFLIRHMPKKSGGTSILIPRVVTCVVRGGRSSGRRPYVQVDGARYTNPVLANASRLIGEELVVEVDDEDLRFCRAYLPDGGELGILKASGRWHLTKHSRKTRKIINSLVAKKILVVSQFSDPVQVYLNFLSTRNKNRRSKKTMLNPQQATEVVRVAKEAGRQRKIVSQSKTTSRETSLADILKSRPSFIGGKLPDLNELMKKKH